MNKVYSYCCKKCWHIWESKNKQTKCPKCKAEELDEQTDLNWDV